jgi:hypothetical protein
MSSEQPRRARETGGASGSPIGSTAAIVIAVIAVVGGFLILKTIRDDGGSSGGAPSGVSPTVPASGTSLPDGGLITTLPLITVPPTEAPTTTAAPITTGATVVVANASTVDGAAKRYTTALKGKKFDVASPANASLKLDVTKVYYDDTNAAALPVANYLASLLGGVTVEVLPSPAPVQDGKLAAGVTILLMLGSDKANLTLDAAGAPTTTTIAGAAATATTAAP